jgi:hypothetical protein
MARWLLGILLVLAPFLGATAHAAAVEVVAAPGLESRRDHLARVAEEKLVDLALELDGLPAPERVEVRLVRHSEDLAKVAPPGRSAPAWAIGVFWPGTDVVAVAARDRNGRVVDLDQTLAHELAHLALDRAIGEGRVPRWLTEGFAWQHSADASWERGWTLMGAVVRGDIRRLHELEDRFPADERAVGLAYAESYDFVGFLVARGRWQDSDDDGDTGAYRQFLAELSQGKSLDDAALSAYGRNIVQLETEWLGTLRDRYLWLPASVLVGMVWGLGGVLLVLAWMRRKRQGRARMRQWELEEALADSQQADERGLLN